jgi:hypothetical protein
LGFERLELKLRSLAGSDANAMQSLKDDLAALLDDVDGIEGLRDLQRQAEEQRQRQDKVQRNRDLGLHIQDLIRQSIHQAGFVVEVVDRGYDLRVYPGGKPEDFDTDVGTFEVGEYFVEVKATSTNDARMTPVQARYAVSHRDNYALCVVDLNRVPQSIAWDDLESADIEPAIFMVPNIGSTLAEVHDRLQYASEEANHIRLENVQQVRYGVLGEVWLAGISITSWINSIRP